MDEDEGDPAAEGQEEVMDQYELHKATMRQMRKLLITPREVSELLDVPVEHIYLWTKKGLLPEPMKSEGGRWYWDRKKMQQIVIDIWISRKLKERQKNE